MSVLAPEALLASPLADLHTIASELSIDGYRRLRRPELIAAILEKQGYEGPMPVAPSAAEPRRGRSRPPATAAADDDGAVAARENGAVTAREEGAVTADGDAPVGHAAPVGEDAPDIATAPADEEDEDDAEGGATTRRRRGRRGGRGRTAARDEHDDARPSPARRAEAPHAADADPEPDGEDAGEEEAIEGVVELLANGSGFVRVAPPDPSDDDVYISSAQVKRCELVSGDRITGPKRAPRRSERFASLIKIETINGRPAAELADGVRFDELPVAFPDERLKIGSDDSTLKAIEWLTPFGKGSRVTIVGAARAGKTEALRRLAEALAGHEELTLSAALAGVRPEEIAGWAAGPVPPAAAVSFAGSEEAQNAAVETVIDQARRLAARGADAVVLIDTLDGCSPLVARRALASARNIVGGGSVTVIATASAPLGGETTVVSLDVALTSIGRFPALDLSASGTMRPELLVGDAGAEAIARTRAEAASVD
jgi:transcription termination factor Rho